MKIPKMAPESDHLRTRGGLESKMRVPLWGMEQVSNYARTLQRSPDTSSHLLADPEEKVAHTHYGTFRAKFYEKLELVAGDTPAGVEMYLEFEPNENVDSQRFGFVQAVRTRYGGQDYQAQFQGGHRVTTGAGAGWSIDGVEGRRSPMYSAPKQQGTPTDNPESLTTYRPSPPTRYDGPRKEAYLKTSGFKDKNFSVGARFGYRSDNGGTMSLKQENAVMYDAPALTEMLEADTGSRFETTILSMQGPQQGLYYGSVQWGYHRDDTGKFELIDFKTISEGTPTVNFLSAAAVWNSLRTNTLYTAAKSEVDLFNEKGYLKKEKLKSGVNYKNTGQLNLKGITYLKLADQKTGSAIGYALIQDLIGISDGQETLNLPITEVYLVRENDKVKADGISLPLGTRVRLLSSPDEKNVSYEVTMGEHTGKMGETSLTNLQKEVLGSRLSTASPETGKKEK